MRLGMDCFRELPEGAGKGGRALRPGKPLGPAPAACDQGFPDHRPLHQPNGLYQIGWIGFIDVPGSSAGHLG